MNPNRILVVEDPDLGVLIQKVATDLGYEVRIATDQLDLASSVKSFQPTHIFLDLSRPGQDGFQCLDILAQARTKACIVLASAMGKKVLETARRYGAEHRLGIAGTMRKPFPVDELRSVLERLKNGHEWCTPDAIMDAMNNGELFLVYQPKVLIPSRRITGFEALVRWRHPKRGLVGPVEFMKQAEQDRLIDDLTLYVLDQAAAQMAQWQRLGFETSIAVNLSAKNLDSAAIPDVLAAKCEEYDVPPSRMVFELTETAAMRDTKRATHSLTRLRLKGFRLAIDDFGTGYSSLVQLHRLPFSELKIDREFVGHSDASEDALTITRSVVDLAHNLGLQATAEGAENAQVLETLVELKCDEAQGYGIAKPLPSTQVPEWVDRWSTRSSTADTEKRAADTLARMAA